MAKGEDYVRLHGGKSIAIGRFVPGVKAVVPGIVGMFRMNQLYFIIINVVSGLVWTLAHILPGILVGKGLSFAGEISGRLAIVLLVLLTVIAVGSWLIRLAAAGVAPYFDDVLLALSNWAKARHNRPMRRLGRVLSPDHPRSYLTLLFLLFCVVGVLVLLDMVFGLVFSKAVSNLDVSIHNLLGELRSAPGDEVMVGLTMLGDDFVIICVGLALVAWLIFRRAVRAGIAVGAFLLAAKGLEIGLKVVTARPRPEGNIPVELIGTFSFPSGHAVMSTVAFGMVAILAGHAMGRWSRAVVAAICGLLIIAIGFSRLYLGAHWMSDVMGGVLLGGILLAGFGVLIEALPARRIRPAMFSLFMALVFAVSAAAHMEFQFVHLLASYSRPTPVRVVTLADYLSTDANYLPQKRIDLVGGGGEPFAAQWSGSAEDLFSVLQRNGWQATQKWTWKDGVGYLNVKSAFQDIKPRPLLHEGLKAKLTAIKYLPDDPFSRLVIRAFQTNIIAADGTRHDRVYALSLLKETLAPRPKVYAIPRDSILDPPDMERILSGLSTSGGVQVLATIGPTGQKQVLLQSTDR